VGNQGGVQIRTPEGYLHSYGAGEKLPELSYGSRIIAGTKPVSVRFFKNAFVVLERHQGIFFSKDPIGGTIEVHKLETKSKNQRIKVALPGNITAYFGADTKITLNENLKNAYLGVKTGYATIRESDGSSHKLLSGEEYVAKKKL
jgi:hypothetical protein